jgi:pimeloyl-ACP methyl ester carboxylesterase
MYRPDELAPALMPLQKKIGVAHVAVPTLYLHGAEDGCIGVDCVSGTEAFFSQGFEREIVPGVGHFLHLEKPEYINNRIGRFFGVRDTT